ncbi:MAG: 50S ribosomal protein L24 [Methanobacteriota archaeon]
MVEPGKARKTLYQSPQHIRNRQVSAHLADALMTKYKRRSVVLRKGDTVKVMRGEFRGHSGKVLAVDVKNMRVHVEGVTVKKSKGQEKPRPISSTNLLVTKLELADRLRRQLLGASEAEAAEAAEAPAAAPGAASKEEEE